MGRGPFLALGIVLSASVLAGCPGSFTSRPFFDTARFDTGTTPIGETDPGGWVGVPDSGVDTPADTETDDVWWTDTDTDPSTDGGDTDRYVPGDSDGAVDDTDETGDTGPETDRVVETDGSSDSDGVDTDGGDSDGVHTDGGDSDGVHTDGAPSETDVSETDAPVDSDIDSFQVEP